MKKLIIALIIVFVPLFCSSQNKWKDLAVTEHLEYYIDSTSLKVDENGIYASVKTMYMTDTSKEKYLSRILRVLNPKSAKKRILKWNDFAYTITDGLYDCSNKRFKILKVEDFTAEGKRIVQTKTKEKDARWLQVDVETVGDYLLFYICDRDL